MAPIHGLWGIFQWNCGTVELYQSNYGMARNREAGGFVNSNVKIHSSVNFVQGKFESSKAVSGLRLKIIGEHLMDKPTLLLRSVSPKELLAIQQILCFSENHTMRLKSI